MRTVASAQRWDIFCRVIDNYGDAAFAWRLACGLAREHGAAVRLWIDEPAALAAMIPAVQAVLERAPAAEAVIVDGIEILGGIDWGDARAVSARFAQAPPAVIVEAFGSGLPEGIAAAAAAGAAPRPLWIVTEYLSAEAWVRTTHAHRSPPPRWPLERWFFNQGFDAGTGGLLREAAYDARRAAWHASGDARAAFLRSLGAPAAADARIVSLFGYPNAGIVSLFDGWAEDERPTIALLAAGPLARSAADALGGPLAPGQSLRRGALIVHALPFLPQPRYDELLWSCDWNFVRGEDSLVRGLWAERPLVWQLYPQADAAHGAKLAAFLERYGAGLPASRAAALATVARRWNALEPGSVGAAWRALDADAPVFQAHSARFAGSLRGLPEFTAALVDFSRTKI